MSEEITKKETTAINLAGKIDVKTIQDFLFTTGTKLSEKQQKLFLQLAIRNQLDPFKREIYAVPFGNDFSIVTGYQVYIQRAEATGLLNGWHCEAVKNEKGELIGAKITIYRKDFEQPFVWEVSLNEFKKDQASWKKMPEFMIKKVCIGQGFRLAFPNELGGLPYLQEELDMVEEPQPTTEETAKVEDKELATDKQIKAIHSIISSKNLDEAEIKKNLGIEHFRELTKEQASDLISDLDKMEKIEKNEN